MNAPAGDTNAKVIQAMMKAGYVPDHIKQLQEWGYKTTQNPDGTWDLVDPQGVDMKGMGGGSSADVSPAEINKWQNENPGWDKPTAAGSKDGPVLQPGTAIPGAEDMNLTKRGPIENAWNQHGDQYWQPGRTDKFADAFASNYGVAGESAKPISNNAQEAYDAYKAGPTSAGLDPYYANAKRTASEDIDKKLSARGMYGSSSADNAIQEAMTNLSAEEANRSADFDLRREALGGSLASGADSSSGAADAAKRAWTEGAGRVAGQADTSDINRLNSGFNAAGNVQTAQEGRQGQAFNQEFSMGKALSDILGTGTTKMIDTDVAGQDNAITTKLGADANDVNAAQGHANERNSSTADMVSTTAGGIKTAIPLIPKAPATAQATQPVPYSATAQYQYPNMQTYPGTSNEPWNQY